MLNTHFPYGIWCCSWSKKICNLAGVISFLHKKVQLWLVENIWFPKHINNVKLMLLRLSDEMMFSDGLKKILIIWINELCINTSYGGFPCSPVISLITAPACFFPFNLSWMWLCVLSLHQPRFSPSTFLSVESDMLSCPQIWMCEWMMCASHSGWPDDLFKVLFWPSPASLWARLLTRD